MPGCCKRPFTKFFNFEFWERGELYLICFSHVFAPQLCCPYAEDATDVASWDDKVSQWCQDHRDELRNPNCMQQLRGLTRTAFKNWTFDRPFADACHGEEFFDVGNQERLQS